MKRETKVKIIQNQIQYLYKKEKYTSKNSPNRSDYTIITGRKNGDNT